MGDELTPFIRAVLRSGIEFTPAFVATDDMWRDALPVLREQRLAGLVHGAVAAGDLVLPEPALDTAEHDHAEAMTVALQLEAMLVFVQHEFDRCGIEMRVIKGPAVAHLDYSAPELRPFGDLDLLVRSDAFDSAVGHLESLGGRRRFREPRPGFTARFGKGVCIEMPNGFEIDLHRALVAGPYALVDTDALLWSHPTSFVVGDAVCLAPGKSGRILGAAVHSVLGRSEPRLVPVRDVAQMLVELDPAEFDELVGVAAAHDLAGVLARAVLVTTSLLRLSVETFPAALWAFGYVATDRERSMIRCYTEERRSYAGQARAAVRALPDWRSRSEYIRALTFPNRAYLAEREGSYARRIRRAATIGKDGQ